MTTSTSLLHQTRLREDRPRILEPRRRLRRSAILNDAGAAHHGDEPVADDGIRPSSELDDARRRVKRNVQEIEAQLRLGTHRSDDLPAESILAEMTRRLQAMATYERTICRSGRFEAADLAIYLKQVATFLSRSRGRRPGSESGSNGGWGLEEAGNTLSWTREARDVADAHPAGLDLGDAVRFMELRWREPVRRAVCACAVMFPPGIFNWRSWSATEWAGDPRVGPGDLGIRLRPTLDHVRVDVWVADHSLGLPRYFEHEGKTALARQISDRLVNQTLDAPPLGAEPTVFEVAFVSTNPNLSAWT